MEPDPFPPYALRSAPLSEHPLSLPRLGAAVDALIRPRAKGKPPRPADPPALFVLFVIFMFIFLSLIFILRSFFPSDLEMVRQANVRHIDDNLRRVAHNLPPTQFWPLPLSKQRALQPAPHALIRNASLDRIWAARFLADRAVSHPLRISLVAACKDRTAFLQTALPKWRSLLHPLRDEIILVDWATSPPDFVPLSEVVRASEDTRVAVVSLTHQSPWVLSRAYNLGFALARGQWILKLDCDTALEPNFLNAHPLPKETDDSFYRFDWKLARGKNEQHLNGIFLARTQHVRAVNGYDERITTYGWEDSDFYTRMEKGHTGITPPLKPIAIDRDTVHHMAHGDALRDADHALHMGPVMQTQVNSQASDSVASWTVVGVTEHTHFELGILSRDARFLGATVVRAPRTLLDQVDPGRRKEIVSEATIRVLHDVYSVPWNVMTELDRSKEHVVRVLAGLGRATKWAAGEGVVFAILQGGVPDRVVGLASALEFARVQRRALFVTWGDGCVSSRAEAAGCKTSEFFNLPLSDPAHAALDDGTRNDMFATGDRALLESTTLSPTFQITRWHCRDTIAKCALDDKTYGSLTEFRFFHGNRETDDSTMLDVLHGKVDGKRNILVKLQGSFPSSHVHPVRLKNAIAKLRLSPVVEQYIESLGDLSQHTGLYIGPSIRWKGVEAIAKRMLNDEGPKLFFVTGGNRELVENARRLLPASGVVADVMKNMSASSDEARENVRQLGDLYALVRCKQVVNDGRPPSTVLQLLDALTKHRQKQHQQPE